MLTRATNWSLPFLYQLPRFKNRNLWYTFQTLFAQKRDLAHPYVLYKNKSFQHFLSYGLGQMTTLLVLKVRFFRRFRFLGVRVFIKSRVQVEVLFLDDAVFSRCFNNLYGFSNLLLLLYFLLLKMGNKLKKILKMHSLFKLFYLKLKNVILFLNYSLFF